MELVISSLGMVTSLGGVVAGSAAQRAGLTRPVELGAFYWAENENLYPLCGHRAVESKGGSQVDRWREMALQATRELCEYGALPDRDDARFWRRTAVMAAVPIMDSERFYLSPEEAANAVLHGVLRPVALALEAPVESEDLFAFSNGQTAFAQALAAARWHIERGRFNRALIVAADSLVHDQCVDWLATDRRLKTSDEPMGLSPSEAAACVLVESDAACSQRGGRAEAVVVSERVVSASLSMSLDVAVSAGRSLAEALGGALGAAGASEPFAGDLFLDVNGEAWRSSAWGHAQLRLRDHVDLGRARIIMPCAELGDTGAASTAIAACLGTRSFVRGYASGRRALIGSVSSRGDASAVLLGPP